MSRSGILGALLFLAVAAQSQTPVPTPETVGSVLAIKRIYVEPLVGGPPADALRDLIIASINSTKLFILTDNPERADAVLKGAADDHAYIDAFDTDSSINTRRNGGASKSGTSIGSRATGAYLGMGVSDSESHHIRERKHEAYASVRLCSRDGDILWSTTQESHGAKFRSASADVAEKIAHQLILDMEKARLASVVAPARDSGSTIARK